MQQDFGEQDPVLAVLKRYAWTAGATPQPDQQIRQALDSRFDPDGMDDMYYNDFNKQTKG